ncbi:MAG TPA: hypothetical protein DCM40_02215, partial [Maribacter sp.]|nr:hypothetical protein [Maribacter sp.]
EIPNIWRGLDTFRGMAPDRLGVPNGEIKAGITYRVLAAQLPSQFTNSNSATEEHLRGLFYIRGEEDKSDQI